MDFCGLVDDGANSTRSLYAPAKEGESAVTNVSKVPKDWIRGETYAIGTT